nr:hypothetical protein [Amycolatopsis sp.]
MDVSHDTATGVGWSNISTGDNSNPVTSHSRFRTSSALNEENPISRKLSSVPMA